MPGLQIVNVTAGFLNLYKPLGWTSHDCVAKVRRLLTLRKVGHGGTLDPAASGVLPIALGRATRLLQFLPGDKAYRAVIRFGLTTTTDDLEGEVATSQSAIGLSQAAAIAPLPQFIGTFAQVPPRYSAVQVQGQRLYNLARKGQEANIPVRTVTVHHITPVKWQPGEFPELTVDIACGTGTYIRSIARDWGTVLGTGATLAALERTQSSGFPIKSSLTLEQLADQVNTGIFTPVPPEITLHHLPILSLTAEDARRWQQGQKIPALGAIAPDSPPFYRVHDPTNRFLGVTRWRTDPETGEIRLRPQVVFVDMP
ncbi:MAG: tRNA pseudouridine(55) synthase TruB [Leptolyngbya sp. SIO1E4]|nr:tRNA pseudouridine(55) synthase TruB [Leptolyngbya sp. SIO1E4]